MKRGDVGSTNKAYAEAFLGEDVARVFAACPDRVMPSASRSLLLAGPDISALRDGAAAMATEFRRLLPGRTVLQPRKG